AIWTWRWDIVLREMGYKLNYFYLYVATIIGNFGDTISPGARMGGEPFRAYYVEKKHKEVKVDDLAASLVLEKMYNTTVFFAITAISIIYILLKYTFSIKLQVPLLIILVLGSGMMAGIFYLMFKTKKGIAAFERLMHWILEKLSHTHFWKYFEKKHMSKKKVEAIFDKHIRKFFQDIGKFSRGGGLWTKGALNAVLYWIALYLQAYLCFLAIGSNISFAAVVAIISISNMAGAVTLLPSGLGIVEIIQTSLSMLFGVALAEAGAAILLLRGNYYLFGIIFGYVVMLIATQGRGHKEIKKHTQEE
ncbi:MAG: lysylphosphatidylglycerol synthase transmembrane domain-containing protein, partial [Candidatus Undinarchaeales archaeon]|nr:lysylphosphatidylglycerol synthase transmembrane domain-containing protein [Candidatus Undinarchaeales archaeon]